MTKQDKISLAIFLICWSIVILALTGGIWAILYSYNLLDALDAYLGIL